MKGRCAAPVGSVPVAGCHDGLVIRGWQTVRRQLGRGLVRWGRTVGAWRSAARSAEVSASLLTSTWLGTQTCLPSSAATKSMMVGKRSCLCLAMARSMARATCSGRSGTCWTSEMGSSWDDLPQQLDQVLRVEGSLPPQGPVQDHPSEN